MTFKGFCCGNNNLRLGDIVDDNASVHTEVGNLLAGDIMLGNLVQLEYFSLCETPTFGEIYKKYKDKIQPSDNLYLVDEAGLTGTIYACGHLDTGIWTVYAKTSGYA
ncbi:hypothetical protein AB6M97_08935 [Streptococcus hillyeri]|uniref:hypothetical protein n=1 Tax=Streptococcus hillyeri TaxID=2282420 RepID=UPI0034E25198